MIVPTFLKDKHIAIMGLGITGLATCRALQEAGAHLYCYDDHEKSRENASKQGFPIHNLYELDFEKLDWLIWSPGIPTLYPEPHILHIKAQKHNVQTGSDIDLLALAQPDAKYICITGTNGKSTTTALIHHILHEAGFKAECGGNLGTAVMDLAPLGKDGIYVLELSSYQLEISQQLKADIGILLNISEDHLKHHANMKNYIAAKQQLFITMKQEGTAIIGVDDPDAEQILHDCKAQNHPKKIMPLCVNNPLPVMPRITEGWLCDDYHGTPSSTDLGTLDTLKGSHNHQNALAAYIACREIGMNPPEIIHHIHSFPGLPHRQQLVKKINRIDIINDSKATNPDAASKALSCYDNIFWLIGGQAKSNDPNTLDCFKPYLQGIKHVYLYGEAAKPFEKWFSDQLDTKTFATLEDAFSDAAKDALLMRDEQSTILLSPACASFDQYKNFEERGDHFIKLVENYTAYQKEAGLIYD